MGSARIHVKAVALTARFASECARKTREFLCSMCLLCLIRALFVVSVIRDVPCLTFLVMPHHGCLVICHGNAVGETTVLFLMHPRCWSLKNLLHLELYDGLQESTAVHAIDLDVLRSRVNGLASDREGVDLPGFADFVVGTVDLWQQGLDTGANTRVGPLTFCVGTSEHSGCSRRLR